MDKITQYDLLSRLEQETTRLRYGTFTALISVSFLLPGFAMTSSSTTAVSLFGQKATVSSLAFLLGFFFYAFSVVHYTWYHRYAHRYRAALKRLEEELGIEIYRLRVRPKIKQAKLHFDWFLYILGAAYFYFTAVFVGWIVTLLAIGLVVGAYLALMAWSISWDDEPLELPRQKNPAAAGDAHPR